MKTKQLPKDWKEVDSFIEYFKNEKELLNDEMMKTDNHQKFTFSTTISMYSVLAIILVVVLDKFILIEKIKSILIVLLTVFFLGFIYTIFHFVYFSWKNEKRYYENVISLNIILEVLWHIKISNPKSDLSLLRNYFNYETKNPKFLFQDKKERYNKFIEIIDKIIKNEN